MYLCERIFLEICRSNPEFYITAIFPERTHSPFCFRLSSGSMTFSGIASRSFYEFLSIFPSIYVTYFWWYWWYHFLRSFLFFCWVNKKTISCSPSWEFQYWCVACPEAIVSEKDSYFTTDSIEYHSASRDRRRTSETDWIDEAIIFSARKWCWSSCDNPFEHGTYWSLYDCSWRRRNASFWNRIFSDFFMWKKLQIFCWYASSI